MFVGEARGCIFSRVRPFYGQAVSNQHPYRSMHRPFYVAHRLFIEGSHMTKNTASRALDFTRIANIRKGCQGKTLKLINQYLKTFMLIMYEYL